jgi:hypothetical protein
MFLEEEKGYKVERICEKIKVKNYPPKKKLPQFGLGYSSMVEHMLSMH